MVSTPRARRRPVRLAALAALALTTGTLAATQLAGAAPAEAVSGIHKETGKVSSIDSKPSKTAPAVLCPVGQRVIGGGGWVLPSGSAVVNVGLTELRPVHPAVGQDSYVVTAQEVTPNVTATWSVQAYALCADPVSGMNIVTARSNPFSEVDVFCPAGQVVLGSGGRVDNPANHVALNFVSPLTTGDRVRVAATDDVPGATDAWTVTAFAVCVPTPPGYQVVFAPSVLNHSEPQKLAFVNCPAGTRVHGAAGGAVLPPFGSSTQGLVLQVIYPSNGLDQVQASAVETTPNSTNWDVRAVAICAV